jgi:hypothetical protein
MREGVGSARGLLGKYWMIEGVSSMVRLTTTQIRELEVLTQSSALLQQLLVEFKHQRAALTTMQQYVEMFCDAEGTVENFGELMADLKETLDGVGSGVHPTTRS